MFPPSKPQDFGVWNITYASVSCGEWKGWGDKSALGSVPNITGCCPADPTVRSLFGGFFIYIYPFFFFSIQGSQQVTCPSYSDGYKIPPDTTTSDALSLVTPALLSIPLFTSLALVLSPYSLFV